jgi:hypothetical protein
MPGTVPPYHTAPLPAQVAVWQTRFHAQLVDAAYADIAVGIDTVVVATRGELETANAGRAAGSFINPATGDLLSPTDVSEAFGPAGITDRGYVSSSDDGVVEDHGPGAQEPPCPECAAQGLSPCNWRLPGEDRHGEEDTETDEPVSPVDSMYETSEDDRAAAAMMVGEPASIGRPAWNRLEELESPLGGISPTSPLPRLASPDEFEIEAARRDFLEGTNPWARIKDEHSPLGSSPRLHRVPDHELNRRFEPYLRGYRAAMRARTRARR